MSIEYNNGYNAGVSATAADLWVATVICCLFFLPLVISPITSFVIVAGLLVASMCFVIIRMFCEELASTIAESSVFVICIILPYAVLRIIVLGFDYTIGGFDKLGLSSDVRTVIVMSMIWGLTAWSWVYGPKSLRTMFGVIKCAVARSFALLRRVKPRH